MDISKILDYQKLDGELFALEKSLRDNPNRKIASDMHKRATEAQKRAEDLEKMAKDLLTRVDKIKDQFEQQNKALAQILAKDVDKMEEQEIAQLSSSKDKLLQNSNILDKNLSKLAESVKMVIDEYQKTSKIFADARNKYNSSKAELDKNSAEIEPKKQELIKKLASEEKNLDKNILEKYKKLRNDNIFPVLVPLTNNHCGFCKMELAVAVVSKINEQGFMQCEHCHRIIYSNK